MNRPQENMPRPDFSILFAQVKETGHVELVDLAKQIDQQAMTIQMISQATEAPNVATVVTYFSN